jgi:porphobilinogen synthase
MEFPVTRLRRLRRTEAMRSLVREVHLQPGALIYPLFVCPGEGIRREVSSMPGVYNLSIDEAIKEVEEAAKLGLAGLLLFGLPAVKDEEGSGAWAEDGIVQQALRAFRPAAKKLLLVADVCLCEYTSHGHCGIVAKNGDAYEVENDSSLSLIARTAVSLAKAGADIVAPSDMMDGRVGAIRDHLDDAGLEQIPILSYAAKVASAFYGPFREAADSAPQFGDRRTYQMDGANLREAMREIDQDIAEGADMILMKPAMPYLDVIRAARGRAHRGVPGLRRIRHAAGRLRQRLAGSGASHHGIAHFHSPCRRGFHRDLLCQRGRAPSGVTSEDLSAVPFRIPACQRMTGAPYLPAVGRCGIPPLPDQQCRPCPKLLRQAGS